MRKSKEAVGKIGEKTVAESIRHLFGKTPHHIYNNLYFLDENGHPFQIDHLVLTPMGLLVIETKHWSGVVYGRAGEDHWTYLARGQSRAKPFYNPILQNAHHIEKLQQVVGTKVPMISCVVFSHLGGELHIAPKMPEELYTLARFEMFLMAFQKNDVVLSELRFEKWHHKIMSARKLDQHTAEAQINYAKKAHKIGQSMAHHARKGYKI
jgi:hypothetical protein